MKNSTYSIASVEREVGLSKDVLRVWERRYGFPTPFRDAHGDRRYPAEQVRRLRAIKRLMDQGHRPGRLLSLRDEELNALLGGASAIAPPTDRPQSAHADLQALADLLRAHDANAFSQALQQRLARQGLRVFVLDTIAPMTLLVGQGWEQGTLQIFEEHLFTELSGRVLRQALAGVPGGTRPRVLLTTLPLEQHGMGLLMLEALLALEGAHCISLGTQMPVADIAQAALAHQADVVALSFSAAFPHRQLDAPLRLLRDALPPAVQLWAGGGGVQRLKAPPGVQRLSSLEDGVEAVSTWSHPSRPVGIG